MFKLRMMLMVLVLAIGVTGWGGVVLAEPIAQSAAGPDTYDRVIQRHGYDRALTAATSWDTGALSQDVAAQRHGYFQALVGATASGMSGETLAILAQHHGYNRILANSTAVGTIAYNSTARHHGYYQAFLSSTSRAGSEMTIDSCQQSEC